MKKTYLIIFLFWGFATNLLAQKLQQPLESFPLSKQGYALLKSGEIVEGKILSSVSTRGITQVNLRDESGEKHKLSASEIQEFAIAMNGAVRFQYFMERGTSVKKLLSKDQPTAKPQDFVIFRNTSVNGKKELLLQLLNPDFDEVFEVFYDPFARKTTELEGEHITWTGGKHRAYFVSKNGGDLIKVKKGNYKRAYEILFGDCPQLLDGSKPKLRDLEKHILLYQSLCSFEKTVP